MCFVARRAKKAGGANGDARVPLSDSVQRIASENAVTNHANSKDRHCQQNRKYRKYGEQSYSTEHRNMDQDDPKIGTCVHYNDVIKHSLLLQMQRRAFSNSKAQLAGTYQKALNLENIKL